MIQRYRLVLQYNGAKFMGYQRNPKSEHAGSARKSIQSELEGVLERLCKKPTTTVIAGRTDAGVHALMNVAHADIERLNSNGDRMEDYSCSLLHTSLNHNLKPKGILIRSVEKIDSSFHARFSCKRRTYHYQFASTIDYDCHPLESSFRWFIQKPLNLDAMKAAAQVFIGRHNFRSFTTGSAEETGTTRTIYDFDIVEDNNSSPFSLRPFATNTTRRYTAIIKARGFLQHQVRKMMASVALAGQGLTTPDHIRDRLASERAPDVQESMAPPEGLCLVEVAYPEERFVVTERSAYDWESQQRDQQQLKEYSELARERQRENVRRAKENAAQSTEEAAKREE